MRSLIRQNDRGEVSTDHCEHGQLLDAVTQGQQGHGDGNAREQRDSELPPDERVGPPRRPDPEIDQSGAGGDNPGTVAPQALDDEAVAPHAKTNTGDRGPYHAEPGRDPTTVERVFQEESARRDQRHDAHDQQSPLADPLLEVVRAALVGVVLCGRVGCNRRSPSRRRFWGRPRHERLRSRGRRFLLRELSARQQRPHDRLQVLDAALQSLDRFAVFRHALALMGTASPHSSPVQRRIMYQSSDRGGESASGGPHEKTDQAGISLSRFRDLLPSRHGRSRTTSRLGVHST